MGSIDHAIGGKESPVDRLIAELAGRQHGVVARWQLVAMGVGVRAIEHRLAAGRLHQIHRGVYAVGHRKLSYQGRWMAAALAYGPDAVLSHYTAAVAWDLLRRESGRIHVAAPRSRHRIRGITLHRPRNLPATDRAKRDGLPVTALCRTLLDLAAIARARETERAFEQAVRMRLLDFRRLEDLLARSRGHRGVRPLKAVIAAHQPASVDARRELERLFLDLVRDFGLPMPAVNVTVEGIEVDAYWPEHGLVAELDSYEHHAGLRPFENDHVQTATLQLADYNVVRLTWTMVTVTRETTAALLQAQFARPAAAAVRG